MDDNQGNRANPGNILKSFPKENLSDKKNLKVVFISIAVVLAGVVTGWFLSGEGLASVSRRAGDTGLSGVEQTATEAGFEDESLFPDSVEGVLREGGIEGEGTHHIERPGGVSKTAYLTSTVIDLQSYVGKEVMIWGETLSAVSAPWLMDVGKLRVIK
jgi:hypothetical protein